MGILETRPDAVDEDGAKKKAKLERLNNDGGELAGPVRGKACRESTSNRRALTPA